MAKKPNLARELGPMKGQWSTHPIKARSSWANAGSRELAKRLAKRLSIPHKDAVNILRIVGQEGAEMAREGWVFSIPYLAVFWTYVTKIMVCSLRYKTGELVGGNIRLNMTESAILKKQFKENRSEVNADKKSE